MKLSTILLWSVVTSWVIACSGETQAGLRKFRLEHRPLRVGLRIAVPSLDDIRNIPVREEGQMMANPIDIASYGLNLHPGTRVVRAAVRAAVKE